jgi:hypothetical protein
MKSPKMTSPTHNLQQLKCLLKMEFLQQDLDNLQSSISCEKPEMRTSTSISITQPEMRTAIPITQPEIRTSTSITQQDNLQIDNTFMKDIIEKTDSEYINLENQLFNQEIANQALADENAAIKLQLSEQQKSIDFLFEELNQIRAEIKAENENGNRNEFDFDFDKEAGEAEEAREAGEARKPEEENEIGSDEFIAKILKSDEQARVEARAHAQLQARAQAQLQLKRLVPNTIANTVQRQIKHFKEQKLFVSCYFNEPFKIDFNTNTSNIKACSDSIRLGMNTKYSNIKDFLLYQTFSNKIFVVAYNNKDDENSNYTGTIHVEVNKHFNTSDINEIKNNDIDMYKEIMNTLQSITPKLSFEKPEGMKMIIIYIKDFKSSNPLYKFIRVFVTNKKTDTYGDYAI